MPSNAISILLLVLLCSPSAHAFDRLKVTAPPAGQDHAERLVGSLAAACNRGDFVDFMSHFTPAQERRVRGVMEDVFIKHQPQMEIHKVTLLSEEEDRIIFGVKYAWHDKGKPEEVFASKVTARLIDGRWKLDGEKVKGITRTAATSDYRPEAADARGMHANWDPFNPPARQISPDLEHLRGDIGIQPGRGCANGRCAVR